jgi:hypothetical protein
MGICLATGIGHQMIISLVLHSGWLFVIDKLSKDE